MQFYNKTIDKGELQKLVGLAVQVLGEEGHEDVVKFLDDIKTLGFRTAFRGGLSFNIKDLTVPLIKEELVNAAHGNVEEVWDRI
jgi:DNA-directed RNA polymerase subunit beta'